MGPMRHAIGVDIGGTAVKLGVVSTAGEVLAAREIPSPVERAQADAILTIAQAIGRLIAETQAGAIAGASRDGSVPPAPSIAAVGIGCAGLVSSATRIVHTSPNLPAWHEAPLGEGVERRVALPTAVLNDANAFALAESRLGAGAGCSPVMALTLGTGVGGALVVDGLLWGGAHGFAGEAGHVSVDVHGPPCPCGNHGCLELYVGRRGLVSAYLERASWSPGEKAFDLAHGQRESLEPRLLARAAELGDRIAVEVFAQAGHLLGAALANLANLLDPEVFVIGGGVAQAGELLLAPARATLCRRAMIGSTKAPPVRAAALGVSAGWIGAGLAALASLDPGGCA